MTPHAGTAERPIVGPDADALFTKRIDLLAAHTPITLAASSVGAIVLAWGIWPSRESHVGLLWWVLGVLGTGAGRMLLVGSYKRRADSSSVVTWAYRLRLGTLVSGALWGTVTFLLSPDADTVLAQAFLLLVVGGLLAGSLGAYAVDLPSFGAFVVPVALPTLLNVVIGGGGLAVVGGVMSLVFTAVVSLYALRLNRTFISALQLQFDNDQLVTQLDREKSRLEALKGELEDRVVERTATLEVTNRRLAGEIETSRRLRDRLLHQATHDTLTQLINRHEFERRLQRVLDTVHSDGGGEHILCYLDLDQFKIINDTGGHAAGDALLKHVAALLRAKVRHRDTLARLGGDEFGILMEHCSLEQATRTATALHAAAEESRFAWDERTFRVGFSMGVVPITALSGDLSDVLRHADAACYAAKDQGRGRFHVVHKADDAIVTARRGEMGWVERLGRALEENHFHLVYQTIHALDERVERGVRCEILLRLKAPGEPAVPAAAFMRSAERYNLAVKIDQWVVTSVLAHLDQAGDLGFLQECSVNLSGQSLGSAEFQDWLLRSIAEARVPAETLCFEITETAAMINLDQGRKFASAIRDLGCRVALDDFGTGFSSFGYLKALPVDYLKIDGTLVQDVASDPMALAMVKSIHDVARLMGKQTVAEYVGNDATIEALRAVGIDFAQGFGFGEPQAFDLLVDRRAHVSPRPS